MRASDLADLPLTDLFRRWPAALGPFLARGMLCVGCPITPFHTLADACRDYRLDQAAFEKDVVQAIIGQPDPFASNTSL